jgi:hypothetical protein
MSHDVFISYSSLDKTIADAACAALEAAGIRCWIAPRDITPGKEWGSAIIDGINESRVMVLVFSAHANDSPQIRREVERAVHKGIAIIPLRIENIVPTRSLEYFIGTVHWLDALTPPMESHLRRLIESVKAILQINPTPSPILTPKAEALPARALVPRIVLAVALSCIGFALLMAGVWWLDFRKGPAETASSNPAPAPNPVPVPNPAPATKPVPVVKVPVVDPRLVGTFSWNGVADGYSANYLYSIAADGTYRLTTTLEERGTFQGGNGSYRTISTTGYVRTGTYRAVGTTGIEITGSQGQTALYQPAEPMPPLDPAQPVMLGRWQANVVKDGLPWTWIVENHSDSTFFDKGQSVDHGTCSTVDTRWKCTSAITGLSGGGTYRVLDSGLVQVTNANGTEFLEQRQ